MQIKDDGFAMVPSSNFTTTQPASFTFSTGGVKTQPTTVKTPQQPPPVYVKPDLELEKENEARVARVAEAEASNAADLKRAQERVTTAEDRLDKADDANLREAAAANTEVIAAKKYFEMVEAQNKLRTALAAATDGDGAIEKMNAEVRAAANAYATADTVAANASQEPTRIAQAKLRADILEVATELEMEQGWLDAATKQLDADFKDVSLTRQQTAQKRVDRAKHELARLVAQAKGTSAADVVGEGILPPEIESAARTGTYVKVGNGDSLWSIAWFSIINDPRGMANLITADPTVKGLLDGAKTGNDRIQVVVDALMRLNPQIKFNSKLQDGNPNTPRRNGETGRDRDLIINGETLKIGEALVGDVKKLPPTIQTVQEPVHVHTDLEIEKENEAKRLAEAEAINAANLLDANERIANAAGKDSKEIAAADRYFKLVEAQNKRQTALAAGTYGDGDIKKMDAAVSAADDAYAIAEKAAADLESGPTLRKLQADWRLAQGELVAAQKWFDAATAELDTAPTKVSFLERQKAAQDRVKRAELKLRQLAAQAEYDARSLDKEASALDAQARGISWSATGPQRLLEKNVLLAQAQQNRCEANAMRALAKDWKEPGGKPHTVRNRDPLTDKTVELTAKQWQLRAEMFAAEATAYERERVATEIAANAPAAPTWQDKDKAAAARASADAAWNVCAQKYFEAMAESTTDAGGKIQAPHPLDPTKILSLTSQGWRATAQEFGAEAKVLQTQAAYLDGLAGGKGGDELKGLYEDWTDAIWESEKLSLEHQIDAVQLKIEQLGAQAGQGTPDAQKTVDDQVTLAKELLEHLQAAQKASDAKHLYRLAHGREQNDPKDGPTRVEAFRDRANQLDKKGVLWQGVLWRTEAEKQELKYLTGALAIEDPGVVDPAAGGRPELFIADRNDGGKPLTELMPDENALRAWQLRNVEGGNTSYESRKNIWYPPGFDPTYALDPLTSGLTKNVDGVHKGDYEGSVPYQGYSYRVRVHETKDGSIEVFYAMQVDENPLEWEDNVVVKSDASAALWKGGEAVVQADLALQEAQGAQLIFNQFGAGDPEAHLKDFVARRDQIQGNYNTAVALAARLLPLGGYALQAARSELHLATAERDALNAWEEVAKLKHSGADLKLINKARLHALALEKRFDFAVLKHKHERLSRADPSMQPFTEVDVSDLVEAASVMYGERDPEKLAKLFEQHWKKIADAQVGDFYARLGTGAFDIERGNIDSERLFENLIAYSYFGPPAGDATWDKLKPKELRKKLTTEVDFKLNKQQREQVLLVKNAVLDIGGPHAHITPLRGVSASKSGLAPITHFGVVGKHGPRVVDMDGRDYNGNETKNLDWRKNNWTQEDDSFVALMADGQIKPKGDGTFGLDFGDGRIVSKFEAWARDHETELALATLALSIAMFLPTGGTGSLMAMGLLARVGLGVTRTVVAGSRLGLSGLMLYGGGTTVRQLLDQAQHGGAWAWLPKNSVSAQAWLNLGATVLPTGRILKGANASGRSVALARVGAWMGAGAFVWGSTDLLKNMGRMSEAERDHALFMLGLDVVSMLPFHRAVGSWQQWRANRQQNAQRPSLRDRLPEVRLGVTGRVRLNAGEFTDLASPTLQSVSVAVSTKTKFRDLAASLYASLVSRSWTPLKDALGTQLSVAVRKDEYRRTSLLQWGVLPFSRDTIFTVFARDMMKIAHKDIFGEGTPGYRLHVRSAKDKGAAHDGSGQVVELEISMQLDGERLTLPEGELDFFGGRAENTPDGHVNVPSSLLFDRVIEDLRISPLLPVLKKLLDYHGVFTPAVERRWQMMLKDVIGEGDVVPARFFEQFQKTFGDAKYRLQVVVPEDASGKLASDADAAMLKAMVAAGEVDASRALFFVPEGGGNHHRTAIPGKPLTETVTDLTGKERRVPNRDTSNVWVIFADHRLEREFQRVVYRIKRTLYKRLPEWAQRSQPSTHHVPGQGNLISAMTGGRGRPYADPSNRRTGVLALPTLFDVQAAGASVEVRLQVGTKAPKVAKGVRKSRPEVFEVSPVGTATVRVPGWLPGLIERSLAGATQVVPRGGTAQIRKFFDDLEATLGAREQAAVVRFRERYLSDTSPVIGDAKFMRRPVAEELVSLLQGLRPVPSSRRSRGAEPRTLMPVALAARPDGLRRADLSYLRDGQVTVDGRPVAAREVVIAVDPKAFLVVAEEADLQSVDRVDLLADIHRAGYKPGQEVVLYVCRAGERGDADVVVPHSVALDLSNALGARVHAVEGEITLGRTIVLDDVVVEQPHLPLSDISANGRAHPDEHHAAQQRYWLSASGRGDRVAAPFGEAVRNQGAWMGEEVIDPFTLGIEDRVVSLEVFSMDNARDVLPHLANELSVSPDFKELGPEGMARKWVEEMAAGTRIACVIYPAEGSALPREPLGIIAVHKAPLLGDNYVRTLPAQSYAGRKSAGHLSEQELRALGDVWQFSTYLIGQRSGKNSAFPGGVVNMAAKKQLMAAAMRQQEEAGQPISAFYARVHAGAPAARAEDGQMKGPEEANGPSLGSQETMAGAGPMAVVRETGSPLRSPEFPQGRPQRDVAIFETPAGRFGEEGAGTATYRSKIEGRIAEDADPDRWIGAEDGDAGLRPNGGPELLAEIDGPADGRNTATDTRLSNDANAGVHIAIIGMGPRGLTVLERVIAQARAREDKRPITIHVLDPQAHGHGVHLPEQPDHLLVNTVAEQITQFSDTSTRDAGPTLSGPSFYEWLHERFGHAVEISPDGYYARSLFGRYLEAAFQRLLEAAPSHVKINSLHTVVVGAAREQDQTWRLTTEDGADVPADYVFLTTGHSEPKTIDAGHDAAPDRPYRVVSDPYPVDQTLAFVQPDMTVAVEGMGLSAFDVLGELTAGRGGYFEERPNGTLRYVRSGEEPTIFAYARSGLPLSARAANQKGVSGQYQGKFLTRERIEELRAGAESGKLDFTRDVLPLLNRDMEYAYYEAYLRTRSGADSAARFCELYVRGNDRQREALIRSSVPAKDRLSWEQLVNPVPADALTTRESFSSWFRSNLERDLQEANRGNVDSPIKAACDVLRDLRDNLRAAIDYGGLTEESHRWLYSDFLPVMNRLAVGPPKQRIAEMLALMDAGVLIPDWGPGVVSRPNADESALHMTSRWGDHVTIDALIKARIAMPGPMSDTSPLTQQLLADGYVKPFFNEQFHPGGLDIDPNHNPIATDGSAVENMWALGLPAEGPNFYTFVVPRPGVNSTGIVDAGRAVKRMFALIDASRADSSSEPRATASERFDEAARPAPRRADLSYLRDGQVTVNGRPVAARELVIAVDPKAFLVVAEEADLQSVDRVDLLADIHRAGYKPGQEVVLYVCRAGERGDADVVVPHSVALDLSNALGARVHAVEGEITLGRTIVLDDVVVEQPHLPLSDISANGRAHPDEHHAAQQRYWLSASGRGARVAAPFGEAVRSQGARVGAAYIDPRVLGIEERVVRLQRFDSRNALEVLPTLKQQLAVSPDFKRLGIEGMARKWEQEMEAGTRMAYVLYPAEGSPLPNLPLGIIALHKEALIDDGYKLTLPAAYYRDGKYSAGEVSREELLALGEVWQFSTYLNADGKAVPGTNKAGKMLTIEQARAEATHRGEEILAFYARVHGGGPLVLMAPLDFNPNLDSLRGQESMAQQGPIAVGLEQGSAVTGGADRYLLIFETPRHLYEEGGAGRVKWTADLQKLIDTHENPNSWLGVPLDRSDASPASGTGAPARQTAPRIVWERSQPVTLIASDTKKPVAVHRLMVIDPVDGTLRPMTGAEVVARTNPAKLGEGAYGVVFPFDGDELVMKVFRSESDKHNGLFVDPGLTPLLTELPDGATVDGRMACFAPLEVSALQKLSATRVVQPLAPAVFVVGERLVTFMPRVEGGNSRDMEMDPAAPPTYVGEGAEVLNARTARTVGSIYDDLIVAGVAPVDTQHLFELDGSAMLADPHDVVDLHDERVLKRLKVETTWAASTGRRNEAQREALTERPDGPCFAPGPSLGQVRKAGGLVIDSSGESWNALYGTVAEAKWAAQVLGLCDVYTVAQGSVQVGTDGTHKIPEAAIHHVRTMDDFGRFVPGSTVFEQAVRQLEADAGLNAVPRALGDPRQFDLFASVKRFLEFSKLNPGVPPTNQILREANAPAGLPLDAWDDLAAERIAEALSGERDPQSAALSVERPRLLHASDPAAMAPQRLTLGSERLKLALAGNPGALEMFEAVAGPVLEGVKGSHIAVRSPGHPNDTTASLGQAAQPVPYGTTSHAFPPTYFLARQYVGEGPSAGSPRLDNAPLRYAGPVKPPADIDPDAVQRLIFDEAARNLRLSHDQTEAMRSWSQHPREEVSGFWDARGTNLKARTIQRTKVLVSESGVNAFFVRFAFENLGGLNAAMGNDAGAANRHFGAILNILAAEVGSAGAWVVPMRDGAGTEFCLVAGGIDEPALSAAFAEAHRQVEEYAAEHGLGSIPHPSNDPARAGVGLEISHTSITPEKTLPDIFIAVGLGDDRSERPVIGAQGRPQRLDESAVLPPSHPSRFALGELHTKLDPDAARLMAFAIEANGLGLNQDQLEGLVDLSILPKDPVLGVYDGLLSGVKVDAVQVAQSYAATSPLRTVYVSLDLASMKSANEALGKPRVNELFAAMVNIVVEEMAKLGRGVVPLRTGGDELGVIVAGRFNEADLKRAISDAQRRVSAFVKAQGVVDFADLKHPGRQTNLSVHMGYAELQPRRQLDSLFTEADAGVDASKRAPRTSGAEALRQSLAADPSHVWGYLNDVGDVHTQRMAHELQQAGHSPEAIAVALHVRAADGTVQEMVIDPSRHARLVPLSEWESAGYRDVRLIDTRLDQHGYRGPDLMLVGSSHTHYESLKALLTPKAAQRFLVVTETATVHTRDAREQEHQEIWPIDERGEAVNAAAMVALIRAQTNYEPGRPVVILGSGRELSEAYLQAVADGLGWNDRRQVEVFAPLGPVWVHKDGAVHAGAKPPQDPRAASLPLRRVVSNDAPPPVAEFARREPASSGPDAADKTHGSWRRLVPTGELPVHEAPMPPVELVQVEPTSRRLSLLEQAQSSWQHLGPTGEPSAADSDGVAGGFDENARRMVEAVAERQYQSFAGRFMTDSSTVHRATVCAYITPRVLSDLHAAGFDPQASIKKWKDADGARVHQYVETSDGVIIDPMWQQFLRPEALRPGLPKVLVCRRENAEELLRRFGVDESLWSIWRVRLSHEDAVAAQAEETEDWGWRGAEPREQDDGGDEEWPTYGVHPENGATGSPSGNSAPLHE